MTAPLDDAATRYVQANGLRFAYQRYGEGNGEPIVLIRGLGTQMLEWSPVLIDSLVAGGLEVVIFDNRDVGLSEKLAQDYVLADMARDVVALMAALGLTPFHVLGISLGGMVAQLLAISHGDELKSLCSVMSSSSNPELPRADEAVRERMLLTASDRDARIELETENRAIFGSPGFPEDEAERRRMSILTHDRCYCPEGVNRQMKAAMADGSRVDRLTQVRVPALVLHGADDPLLPPECGEDTARHIPNAELQLVDGMGHNIPHSLAPDIAMRVLRFIQTHN